ncbi:Aqualysin-1 [Symbiodinium microadriaticum]|uniref:subtilisin n=1 Tax=Symbiodinium microadriaticum TaxID=2951 RepID=A0A1Q9C045_SYMMI|nr:Aqualysin-1 [Symbiodinium microadriaticum]
MTCYSKGKKRAPERSYRYRPKAGERVHVYVVDSGIRTSHRDFGGRAVPTLEAKNAGITVVNAAGMHGTGNVGPDACHHTPSYLQDVITVGATTRDDARANFSQVGQCVDLLAPGAAVRSAGISSDHAETTLSGTSPAAAYAAGAAALLLAEKPDLSPEEVKQALIRRATVGRVSNLGGAPDRLVNSLGGVPKVPNWAEEPEGMWSLVDGGVDRECGGSSAVTKGA